MTTKWTTSIWLLLSMATVSPAADGWPQFRGTTGDGHSAGSNLPDVWSESQNVAWKVPVLGRGWSSPAVADGLVWLTYATVEEFSEKEKQRLLQEKLGDSPFGFQGMNVTGPVKLFVVAIDLATGTLEKTIPLGTVKEPDPIHSLNSYASPSPIASGGKIICHFGKYGTFCLDATSGKILWQKQFVIDHSVGPGSSPALCNKVVIIPCDGTDAQFVVGLDLETGEELWRTNRPPMTGATGDYRKAFTTPLVVHHNGEDQVIIAGAQWFVSYEPKDGSERWRFRHGEGFSNVPSPVVKDGIAYLCTGFESPELCAIRIDGRGDVTETAELWRHRKQVPTMSSPIVIKDAIYFVSDKGVLTCLNIADGSMRWQNRLKGNFIASPIYANDKLYFCSREGETTVVRPGGNFDEVALNVLPDQLLASPSVVADALLLRGESYFYKIQKLEKVERATRKSP